MAQRELVKVCKNGTKVWKELVQCPRCGGHGLYFVGVMNDRLIPAQPDHGKCYQCGGSGKIWDKVYEYTPEHEAELEAKRQKRAEEQAAQIDAERKAREERAKAEEARKAAIAAEKASHVYVGEIGKKIEMDVTIAFETSYGTIYGRQYIIGMRDADNNLLVWKTNTGSLAIEKMVEKNGRTMVEYDCANKGDKVTIKGTIKAHQEYKGEKQTILTRVKLVKFIEKREEEA